MEVDADSCLACTWTLPLFIIKLPLFMLVSGSHATLSGIMWTKEESSNERSPLYLS